MRPRKRTDRNKRQAMAPGQTFAMDSKAWDRMVDALAMHLCPTEEWQAYEKKLQYLVWKSKQRQTKTAKVCVFPVWRKYRHQAQKIVNLQHVVPLLRHLPLPVSSFLGKVFF
jgi:hypothetical protein